MEIVDPFSHDPDERKEMTVDEIYLLSLAMLVARNGGKMSIPVAAFKEFHRACDEAGAILDLEGDGTNLNFIVVGRNGETSEEFLPPEVLQ